MALLLGLVLAVLVTSPPQAAPLTSPFQVIAEPKGTLLVADGGSGRVVRVDPRTGRRTVVARGLGQVDGVAYGPGGLYILTETRVLLLSRGHTRVVARGLRYPRGLAVAHDGTVYVSESDRNRIDAFAPRTGARTIVASTGLDQPLGLALTADGSLLVCDSHHGRVARVGPGGTLEPVLEGLGLPVGLTVASGGDVYVADHVEHGHPGTIVRLHPDGTTETLSVGKIFDLSGVAVTRTGIVYATSFLAPFIGRVDVSGRLRRLPGG
jgi:sugar lactone lactonase YvrE